MTRFPDSAESIEAKVIGPRLAAWLESHWHERDVLDLPPPSKQRRCQRKLPPPNGLLTRAQAATKLNCSLRTLDGPLHRGRCAMSTSATARNAHAAWSPMPISTNLSQTKPARTFHVHPPRPALAILDLQLPNPRSSVLWKHKEDDATRSGSGRARRAREGEGAGRSADGRADIAQA